MPLRQTLPLILFAACAEGVGNYNLKKYSKEEKIEQLALAVGSYGLLMYLLIKCFKDDQLSNVNVTWNMFSQIINTGVGVGILGEQLTEKELLGQGLTLGGSVVIATEPARPN
jgi:multidrug transporter EmrE-like cation transporter